MGPWMPGDDLYEKFTKTSAEKPDRLEASVLTVNYDPGRGVKYLGSGLIVAGIFTMFYMKAYFFQPRRRREAEDQESAPGRSGTTGGVDRPDGSDRKPKSTAAHPRGQPGAGRTKSRGAR